MPDTSRKHGRESLLFSKEDYFRIGLGIGMAVSINRKVAELIGLKVKSCKAEKFNVVSKDLHFPRLLAPLASREIRNVPCFFMPSELPAQVNSVEVIHRSGFFSDLLYIKPQSPSPLTTVHSMKSFVNSKVRGLFGKRGADCLWRRWPTA